MKKLLLAITFLLFLAGYAHSQHHESIEISAGLSSPNKGLIGARYSLMPFSAGLFLGSLADYTDFGLAASYHFSGFSGFYVFSSHHLLLSDKGPAKTVWEMTTGGGAQYAWNPGIFIYAELGIPIYIGGGQIWRYYEAGRTYNRATNGDIVLISFRTGLGLGWMFKLW